MIDAAKLKASINAGLLYQSETGHPVPDVMGTWVSVKCPFHEDRHPSLRLLVPDGAYRCMACGEAGGDVIDFIMKLRGLPFRDALTHLHATYGGGA